MISEQYKNILIEKHKETSWATTGPKHYDKLEPLINEMYNGCSILDYGCGKGVLLKLLKELYPKNDIYGYDPAVEKYQKTLEENKDKKFDLIISTDVLEHVEPEYLDDVLKVIHDLQAPEGRLFFVVFTREAANILPDGRNAHLIIKSAEWWHIKLRNFFPSIDMVYKTPTEVTFIA